MKMYVWEYVRNLTNSYHSEGGYVAIADSLQEARDLLKRPGCEIHNMEPDFSCAVETQMPRCWIFPDAGCC